SRTQKLVLAGILSGLAVIGSLISFPILGSRAAPVQHIINIICAVLLGPSYGVAVAFIARILRNLFGIGTIIAVSLSMIYAFLCGLIFAKTMRLFLTSLGEIIGTGILGGLVAWPLAILFLGESVGTLAFYAYVIPFLISTITGTVIAVGIINILKQNNIITWLERSDRSNDRD